MSLFEILSTLLIGPLKLIFEIIFAFAYKLTDNPGLAIIILSVIMNFLLLPLYRRADAIQEHSRDVEQKLSRVVNHIKQTFSGDERMMILQTYYRQNHYKPTDALNGSVSLMLEIPFFMAAYQFLSGLQLLEGIALGPVADLSAPDGLIVVGSMTLNALPILMTLVNVVSSSIYLKDFPLKTKIQLYAMALVFLVVLYNSPSGLVLYWTMNNLFSLGKTLFYKLKNPLKVISIGGSVAGFGVWYYALFLYGNRSIRIKVLALAIGLLLQLPMLWALFGKKLRGRLPAAEPKPDRKAFLAGGLFLAVLTGLLIPTTFIAAAPQEYVDVTFYHNPLWYIVSAGCLASGTFLVWMNVFYWLANERIKAVMDKLVWILSGIAIVNYMFFGTNLGMLTANLQYEKGMSFTQSELLLNICVMAAVAAVFLLIALKFKKAVVSVLLTAAVALGSMSVVNVFKINRSLQDLESLNSARNNASPHFELSTTGENVVVIMLDRALGEYVPYLLNERPELQEQFAGFTYYENTISFGGYTKLGAPSLFGGYEYTPVEMNKRSEEPLAEKHNEALKLMPAIFAENGFRVTACDPPYVNYRDIPDLSIYDGYENVTGYITSGKFSDPRQKEVQINSLHRNFFCFSIMKSMPLLLQKAIYNGGAYNEMGSAVTARQVWSGMSTAKGLFVHFMDHFGVLQNLPQMTNITESGTNTFLVMANKTTHDAMLLQEPDYLPVEYVDNTSYDAAHEDRFTLDGRTLDMESYVHMSHYQSNMAAFIQLGNWFDYLREQGVYDNTRIILVSDHGWEMGHLEELEMETGEGNTKDVGHYFPLLMVKDFDSHEFTVSDAFMTNADVPTLAMAQLIENPVNPFTGKTVNNDEKYAHDQMIILSEEWDVETKSYNTYQPSPWAAVSDSIWDQDNWSFYNGETVLAEHVLPE